MEEQKKEEQYVYTDVIGDYVNAMNAQMNIVPMSYKFLLAKIIAERKKVDQFSKDHGELCKEGEKEYIKMPWEHSAAFSKMLKNISNTALAVDMTGVNTVIGMVSKYDGFLGNLMKQIFADKPEILNGSDKDFKVSDILSYTDFHELKDVLVEKEIESLLRKSHVDQFQWLESKLKITLRNFKQFPEFVEIMARRNLFVHCNGVVSRQYISECKKNAVSLPEDIRPGTKLDADMKYVEKTFKVLFLVGVMLGFVIWHKLRPNESEEIVDGLSDVAYDLIRDGEYHLGLEIIDFALLNKSWAKEIKTAQQLVFRVNKALSFHLRNMQDECNKIVDSMDLTAAEPVYHLAAAVLKKDYDNAYRLMDKIGKDEKMRGNYKTWPLFNKIRQEDAFIAKFKEIYSDDYECNDTHVADFEEVLKSASEMVERTKSMMDEKVKKGELDNDTSEIEEAEIIEEGNTKEGSTQESLAL